MKLTDIVDSEYKKEGTNNNNEKYNHKISRRKGKGEGLTFALSGVHGVGKTTIYNLLQKKFTTHPNIHIFPERLRANPPVPFGSKDKEIAFRSEVHYNQQMIKRNELVKKFINKSKENLAILDRSHLSVLVYSRAMGLPNIDFNLIKDTYDSVDWQNEYVIYLEADPTTTMERISKRGSLDMERKKWNEEDIAYLRLILKKYEKTFREMEIEKFGKLFRVKTDNKTPQEIVDEIVDIIEKKSGLQLQSTTRLISKSQTKIFDWL